MEEEGRGATDSIDPTKENGFLKREGEGGGVCRYVSPWAYVSCWGIIGPFALCIVGSTECDM